MSDAELEEATQEVAGEESVADEESVAESEQSARSPTPPPQELSVDEVGDGGGGGRLCGFVTTLGRWARARLQVRRKRLERLGNLPLRSQTAPASVVAAVPQPRHYRSVPDISIKKVRSRHCDRAALTLAHPASPPPQDEAMEVDTPNVLSSVPSSLAPSPLTPQPFTSLRSGSKRTHRGELAVATPLSPEPTSNLPTLLASVFRVSLSVSIQPATPPSVVAAASWLLRPFTGSPAHFSVRAAPPPRYGSPSQRTAARRGQRWASPTTQGRCGASLSRGASLSFVCVALPCWKVIGMSRGGVPTHSLEKLSQQGVAFLRRFVCLYRVTFISQAQMKCVDKENPVPPTDALQETDQDSHSSSRAQQWTLL